MTKVVLTTLNVVFSQKKKDALGNKKFMFDSSYQLNLIDCYAGNNGHPGKAGAKGNKGPEGHAVSLGHLEHGTLCTTIILLCSLNV